MATFDFPILYSDGTVDVTNGSDVVNGTFTVWVSALLPGDDFICGGQINVVKEVISDTQIKLAMAWGGATATGATYTCRRWMQHTDPRWYGVKISQLLTSYDTVPVDAQKYRDEARSFAIEAVDTEVYLNPGQYSAYHWSVKAQTWRNLAQLWAEQANGVDVDGVGTRSAKHWANQASTSASNASLSASSALTYNTRAAIFATTAQFTDVEPTATSNFGLSLNSWVGVNATFAIVGGFGKLSHTAADGSIRKTGLSINGTRYTRIVLRARRTAGTGAAEGFLYWTTAGHGESSSYQSTPLNTPDWTLNNWNTLVWDITDTVKTTGSADWLANTITGLRIDLTGGASDVFDIAWLAVVGPDGGYVYDQVQAVNNTLTAVNAVYDTFDDRFLGAKAAAPTVDNDGNALLVGAMYWNTTSNLMFIWKGTAWVDIAQDSYVRASSDALAFAIAL